MHCQLTLPAATATRLRMALRQAGFGEALEALLDDWVIDAARFPQLRLLCWNRSSLLLTAREALDLYEANWRFVEPGALEPAEATVVAAPDGPVKFEIVLEARITLDAAEVPGLPVPCLDPASCFAEKFLANADRWMDAGAAGRDVIDLAFMLTAWSRAAATEGLARAEQAYGATVVEAAAKAARHMLDDERWRRDCVTRLSVGDSRRLLARLRRLAG